MRAHLLSDVDGVVLDSYAEHLAVTGALLRLLGDHDPLRGRDDERARFSASRFAAAYGADTAEAIIAARPALMAARVARTPVIAPMIRALRACGIPVSLVTAGDAASVRRRLGADASGFVEVVGNESGDKVDLLRERAAGAVGYVTDTVRDVERCARAGIVPIGVAWGFDRPEALSAAGCDRILESPADLDRVIAGLNP